MDESLLGTSAAEELLARWHSAVKNQSAELAERSYGFTPGWRRATGIPGVGAFADPSKDEAAFDVALKGLSTHGIPGHVLASLAGAVREARQCVRAAKDEFYGPFAVFGEVSQTEEVSQGNLSTDLLLELAEMIPKLQQLGLFVKRVESAALHIMQQLAGIHTISKEPWQLAIQTVFKKSTLTPLIDALGATLAILATIDGIVLDNDKLKDALSSYRRVLEVAGGEQPDGRSTPLSLTQENLLKFSQILNEASLLVQGNALQRCLAQDFGFKDDKQSSAVRDHLLLYLKARAAHVESGVPGSTEYETPEESLVPWVCVFVLFARVWPQVKEPKLFLSVWRLWKRLPVVALCGRVAWCPEEFLRSYLPVPNDTKLQKELRDVQTHRRTVVSKLEQGAFASEILQCRADVMTWLGRLNTVKNASLASNNVGKVLLDDHDVMFCGLGLALRVRTALETYLTLHIHEEVPVTPGNLRYVSLGFETVKVIEAALSGPRLVELSILLCRRLALKLQQELEQAKAKVARKGPILTGFVDAALQSLYEAVGGSPPHFSEDSMNTLAVAMCCGTKGSLVASIQAKEGMSASLWRELCVLSRWQCHLDRACDTSWAFWTRGFFPELCKDIFSRPQDAPRLYHLCRAFIGAFKTLTPSETPMGQQYFKELKDALDEHICEPLTQKIEEELRIQTHVALQLSPGNLPKPESRDFSALLRLRPLCVAPSTAFDVKHEVEQRLDRKFYKLTALALHDAHFYEQLRALAKEKYDLELQDGYLPGHSLDHGLDVVEVMRKIHLFVAQYSYDLNAQHFVQAAHQSDKTLRTLCVDHMVNSIRAHGTGVINTTVNFTYGFLKRKIEVVTEFLADESVKSRLLSDAGWLESERASHRGYTFARALETAKFIRRVGAANNVSSLLDKVRQVVTQIGNCLGYVRMVRSAGLRGSSKSLPFMDASVFNIDYQDENEKPEDAEAGSFLKAVKDAERPALLVETARRVDEVTRDVEQAFKSTTDYLNLLTRIFASALRPLMATGQSPISQFYLVLPPLILSFVDALIVGKDSLARRAAGGKAKGDCFFVDDGFALGVACILRILGQERQFEALHFFQAVKASEREAGIEAQVGIDDVFADGSLGTASQRRQALFAREVELLSCTIDSAVACFSEIIS